MRGSRLIHRYLSQPSSVAQWWRLGRLWVVGVTVLMLCSLITSCSLTPKDTLSEIKKRGYIKVGTIFTSPPFGSLDDFGEPVGYNIDLTKAISRRLVGQDKHIEYVEISNPNRLSAVNSGEVDFILDTFTITEARKAHFDFSKPYHIAHFRILVRDTSPFMKPSELNGKKVGFMFGGTSNSILVRHYPQYQLVGFNSFTAELESLLNGQIEGLGCQEASGYTVIKKQCGVKLLDETIEDQPYAVGYRKHPATKPLQQELQQILDDLEKDGTMAALRKKWLTPPTPHPCEISKIQQIKAP